MNASPEIHVGIMTAPSISFRLMGNYVLSGTESTCTDQGQATLVEGRIALKLGKLSLQDQEEVTFVPSDLDSDLIEIEHVKIGIDFHWEQEEIQRFQGALRLTCSGGQIQVINILPLELYLNSVISSEMSANSHISLLKAHTIISRSWLLAQMEKQQVLSSGKKEYQSRSEQDGELIRWYDREDHTLFHVCADDHCQRYQGYSRVSKEHVIQATRETRGKCSFLTIRSVMPGIPRAVGE